MNSQRFGRGQKLQYLVKWKGYPDSENQWVDKDDIFADKALQEFKSLKPTSEVHIRHLHVPEDHIIIPTAKYMSSPTPSTIENVVLPSYEPHEDYSISHIFRQLIKPKRGQVHPSSWSTKKKEQQGNPEWRRMVREWQKEQILQGRHLHMLWSISHPPVTSHVFCAPTTIPRYRSVHPQPYQGLLS